MKQSERERLLAETLEHLMEGGGMNFRLSTGNGFAEAQEIALSEDLIGNGDNTIAFGHWFAGKVSFNINIRLEPGVDTDS
jgi:hypothetical protein